MNDNLPDVVIAELVELIIQKHSTSDPLELVSREELTSAAMWPWRSDWKCKSDRNVIFIPDSKDSAERLSSLAHSLGHWFCHEDVFVARFEGVDQELRQDLEAEADSFAAELLAKAQKDRAVPLRIQ